ncbi:MAG: VWA domain-containing protein [Gaiellaceae bacterium]
MATSVTFLTPLGALLALGALGPLVALLAVRRRANGVRRAVGLNGASVRRLLVPLVALVAAGGLLGAAAAQPVLERTSTRRVRTDTEVFFVVDVSRSMLAQDDPGSPTRIDRAKVAAGDLRSSLAGFPVGIASLTDRVLPHLFPSADVDVFQATLDLSIGIERPPPRTSFASSATKLGGLAALRTLRFFDPDTERRLVVVFTDGESQPVARARLATLFRQEPVIDTIFVHVWGEDERVYSRGVPEPQYRSDPSSRAILDGIAASLQGSVFSDRSIGVAGQRARQLLADGPSVPEDQQRGRDALAPYLAIVAFLPLGLLLWRRDR